MWYCTVHRVRVVVLLLPWLGSPTFEDEHGNLLSLLRQMEMTYPEPGAASIYKTTKSALHGFIGSSPCTSLDMYSGLRVRHLWRRCLQRALLREAPPRRRHSRRHREGEGRLGAAAFEGTEVLTSSCWGRRSTGRCWRRRCSPLGDVDDGALGGAEEQRGRLRSAGIERPDEGDERIPLLDCS